MATELRNVSSQDVKKKAPDANATLQQNCHPMLVLLAHIKAITKAITKVIAKVIAFLICFLFPSAHTDDIRVLKKQTIEL